MNKRLFLSLALAVCASLSACSTATYGVQNQFKVTELQTLGDKLYVANRLNLRTFGQIKQAIKDNPNITTLVLTVIDGSMDDETLFEMGRWVRLQKLNTHLTAQSVIAAGGVDFFLAGYHRTMERGARIGVNSWYNGKALATDYPRDHEEHTYKKDYITWMSVPEDFYWFTVEDAPALGLRWLTEAEIERFELLTKPIINADTSGDIPFTGYNQARDNLLAN